MKFINYGQDLKTALKNIIGNNLNICFSSESIQNNRNAFSLILKHKNSIQFGTIALNDFSTPPDVLNSLLKSDNVHFFIPEKEAHLSFHPQVYYFENNKTWDLLIDFVNMSGFLPRGHNQFVLHLTNKDDKNNQIQIAVKKYIESEFINGVRIDERYSRYYGMIHSENIDNNNILYSKRPPQQIVDEELRNIFHMDWNEYYEYLCNHTIHDTQVSMSILDQTNKYFKSKQSFRDMNDAKRIHIAGITSKKNLKHLRTAKNIRNIIPRSIVRSKDLAWSSLRIFGNLDHYRIVEFISAIINQNDQYHNSLSQISDALDRIPHNGDLNKDNLQAYHDLMLEAFPQNVGYACLTRLLAIKRPDYFLPVNGNSRDNIATICGFETSEYKKKHKFVNLYWDNIICKFKDTKWWDSVPPNDKNSKEYFVWTTRMLMLDGLVSIY
jgi:hypothetical protein